MLGFDDTRHFRHVLDNAEHLTGNSRIVADFTKRCVETFRIILNGGQGIRIERDLSAQIFGGIVARVGKVYRRLFAPSVRDGARFYGNVTVIIIIILAEAAVRHGNYHGSKVVFFYRQ